jgi:hypothetical protein
MDRQYILDKIRYWESQLQKVSDYSNHYQPKYRKPYSKRQSSFNFGREIGGYSRYGRY